MITPQQFPEFFEDNENSDEFNTGKIHGLTNSYNEIIRQRKSLTDLNALTVGQFKKMREEFITQNNAIKKELSSLEETRNLFFKKNLESIPDLIRIYKKKLENEASDNEWVKEKAKELYQVVEDRFMLEWDQLMELSKSMQRFIDSVENMLPGTNSNMNAAFVDFSSRIEKAHTTLLETERGFWNGNAIRVALNQ